MGRGGGGSGKGAGGGGRISGGREEPRPPHTVVGKGDLSESISENILFASKLQDKAYADLPSVENANRYINELGQVIVGEKGAPKPTNTFSNLEDAWNYLHKEVGLPNDVMGAIQSRSKEVQLNLANLFANRPDVKYIARGAEGVTVSWGRDKVLRIQYEGGKPLPTYNMGKAGVYPDWLKQYGKSGFWVEQKERIKMTASEASLGLESQAIETAWNRAGGTHALREVLEQSIKRANSKLVPNDAHSGNWGIDFRGRLRAFDPGAFTPPGASVLAER